MTTNRLVDAHLNIIGAWENNPKFRFALNLDVPVLTVAAKSSRVKYWDGIEFSTKTLSLVEPLEVTLSFTHTGEQPLYTLTKPPVSMSAQVLVDKDTPIKTIHELIGAPPHAKTNIATTGGGKELATVTWTA